MTQPSNCAWCGRGIARLPRGRPRLYCRRSHRQRAYEARLLAQRMGLDSGEALVSAEELRRLQQSLVALARSLAEVRRALAADPEAEGWAFSHLYAAAAPLEGARLEPRALAAE